MKLLCQIENQIEIKNRKTLPNEFKRKKKQSNEGLVRGIRQIILEFKVFGFGKKMLHVAVFDFSSHQNLKRNNKLQILLSDDFLQVECGRLTP